MIILDTHIWVWWVHGDASLPNKYRKFLEQHESAGFGVSIISCWEVAKLVEYGRLKLPCTIEEWIAQALNYPHMQLLDLTPQIVIESTQLPAPFHRDPADQLIVATSRVLNYPLITVDNRILEYQHVLKI